MVGTPALQSPILARPLLKVAIAVGFARGDVAFNRVGGAFATHAASLRSL